MSLPAQIAPVFVAPVFIAPVIIAPAILDTVLTHLAMLFVAGAAGDQTAAREAATAMLAAYDTETEEELRLATEIISFGFHALEALSQAAAADLSLAKILRLRGSAVSLSRESHKAQRKLDHLQRARRVAPQIQAASIQAARIQAARIQAAEAQAAEPKVADAAATPTQPQIERAIGLIEFAQEAIEAAGKTNAQTWTQSFQKRQTAKRIAENMKKNQARHASQTARLHVPEAVA
jgi:hypothetical protein